MYGVHQASSAIHAVLSWSPEAWTAAGTWATVLIAVAATWFAYHQVREARSLRQAQTQPFVVVTLEPSSVASHLVMLRVENIGQTLARDVSFEFTPPLKSVLARKNAGYSLKQSRLVQEGLPTMPPGMRIERIFDNAIEWNRDGDESEQPTLAYDVTVNFRDHRGRPQDPLTYRGDLSPYLDGRYVEIKSVHHVAKNLDEIRKILKRWGEGASGLKVWSRDGDAKDERARAEYERRQEERRT